MKAIKDKYNPNLSVKENAEICNCSESTIRHYIKVNCIDRKYDEALRRWKLINDFAKQHQDLNLSWLIHRDQPLRVCLDSAL